MPEQRSWNLKRKDFVKWHLNHVLECIDAIVDVGGMRCAILIPMSCNVWRLANKNLRKEDRIRNY